MSNVLFACDIDNTMIYSKRHTHDGWPCVEWIDGEEQAYASPGTMALLPEVMRRTLLVPVTSRSMEQYGRLRWPVRFGMALTANGADLLLEGVPEVRWRQETDAMLFPWRNEIARCFDMLAQSDRYTRCRTVDDAYLICVNRRYEQRLTFRFKNGKVFMEAIDMAKKTAVLTCPDCGTVVEMEYGLFKKTQRCPKCNHVIDIRRDAMQTIVCPHCLNEVYYDARKGLGQLCPACHEPIQSRAEQKKYDDIPCPFCGVLNRVRTEDETFTCISCHRQVDAKASRGTEEAKNAGTAYVIKPSDARDFLIWKHPLDRFPYASRIIVPDGMTALLLRNGVCTAPAKPGSYLLQESLLSLGEQLESAVNDADQQVTVDVYFVNDYIGKRIKWGEPLTPIRSADGKTWGSLAITGTVSVRVINSQILARFVNYQAGTEDDLLWIRPAMRPDAPTQFLESSKLMNEIRARAFDGANLAAQDLAAGGGWDLNDLKRNRYQIEKEARRYVNDRLQEIGLEAVSFGIVNVDFTEDAESKEKKEEIERQADAEKNVRLAAERAYAWESDPLHVHQKGDPALSAEITLDGRFKLRIIDERAFLGDNRVRHWIESDAAEAEIRAHYVEQVRELMKNVFADVLQPMIDDTGADVNELHRYFSFLRNSVQGYLNRSFMPYGLEVEQFTMTQKAIHRSPELQRLTSFASRRTDAEIEQQAREFERRMQARDVADATQHEVEMNRIVNQAKVEIASNEADTGAALDDIMLRKERHDENNAAERQEMEQRAFERKIDLERAMQEKQRELDQLRQSWQQADEDALEARGFIRQRNAMTNRAELDALSDDIRKSAKLRSIDELRAEWEARRRFDEQKLDADMRDRERAQAFDIEQRARQQSADQEASRRAQVAGIEADAREAEASRKRLLDNAENRRLLNDIMRRIAESDMALEEKTEAYRRLVRNADAQDARANALEDAKAQSEGEYAVLHTKLQLSREQIDLNESLARFTEERDERRKEADLRREELRKAAEFQRDMEREQTKLADDMARMKAEFDQKNIEDQMKERLEMQDREIEKLRIMLGHYEAIGAQGVDAERIRQNAQSVRAQAELDYREKNERRDAEREERRERERHEREQGFADQSERLLTRMWEIQEALKKMELETEQKRDAGNAEVRVAQANAEQQRLERRDEEDRRAEQKRIDEIVQSVEDMTQSIRKAIKKLGRQINQGNPGGYNPGGYNPGGYNPGGYNPGGYNPAGNPGGGYNPGGYGGAPQPGMGDARVCPHCGAPVGRYDNYCKACQRYLG